MDAVAALTEVMQQNPRVELAVFNDENSQRLSGCRVDAIVVSGAALINGILARGQIPESA
jgi:hypothetical protein